MINSVELTANSVRYIGLHTRLVLGFSFEIIIDFDVKIYLLLLTSFANSKTGYLFFYQMLEYYNVLVLHLDFCRRETSSFNGSNIT